MGKSIWRRPKQAGPPLIIFLTLTKFIEQAESLIKLTPTFVDHALEIILITSFGATRKAEVISVTNINRFDQPGSTTYGIDYNTRTNNCMNIVGTVIDNVNQETKENFG